MTGVFSLAASDGNEAEWSRPALYPPDMTAAFSGSTTEVLILGSLHLDAGTPDQALT